MTRILFVDDDQHVLDGLRRMLFRKRNEWDMEFIANPLDVMATIDAAPVDIIVTDMQMPGIDGLHLLEQVKLRHPRTVRIILSGQFDASSSIGLIGVAHQFIAKPCDPDELTDIVTRASALRERLRNDSLIKLVSRTSALPSPPSRFAELMRLVQSPDSSLAEIASVIAADTAMTAKVIQIVNSSFFGLRRRITDPSQAVAVLGIDNLVALALGAHVFAKMNRATEAGLNLDREQDRCLAVAVGAKAIARSAGLSEEEASPYYLAGMLHDVGRLVLASNYPARYRAAAEAHHSDVIHLEEAEFGASHEEVGAYLLGVWGLPDEVVEATAYHHRPSLSEVTGFTPLVAVHLAQAIANAEEEPPQYDDGYLHTAMSTAERTAWETAALEAMTPLLIDTDEEDDEAA